MSVFFLYATPKASFAQYFTGVLANSMGGAGRASAETDETVFLNPATLVHGPAFSSNVFYQEGGFTQSTQSHKYGVSFVDNSQDVLFSGGFAYLRGQKNFNNFEAINEEFMQVSLGGFIHGQVSAGVNFTRLVQKESSGSQHVQMNGDIGLMWNPSPQWALGGVYYNVKAADENLSAHLRELPVAAFGFTYLFSRLLSVRLDGGRQMKDNPDGKYFLGVGLESEVHPFWIFRGGYKVDKLAGLDLFTAGIGFRGPRFRLDYFYQLPQKGGDGSLHGVDMRVSF